MSEGLLDTTKEANNNSGILLPGSLCAEHPHVHPERLYALIYLKEALGSVIHVATSRLQDNGKLCFRFRRLHGSSGW